MNCFILRAERSHAETVLDLITALAHYEKLDPPSDDARARLIEDGWGASSRFEAWLAESDGRPVGYAIAFHTYSTFLARPTLYLEDFFILPESRGNGFGYTLFSHIARHAVLNGCGRMEWACLDWNEVGLRFYDRVGATPLSDWRYFRLTPEQITSLDGGSK